MARYLLHAMVLKWGERWIAGDHMETEMETSHKNKHIHEGKHTHGNSTRFLLFCILPRTTKDTGGRVQNKVVKSVFAQFTLLLAHLGFTYYLSVLITSCNLFCLFLLFCFHYHSIELLLLWICQFEYIFFLILYQLRAETTHIKHGKTGYIIYKQRATTPRSL